MLALDLPSHAEHGKVKACATVVGLTRALCMSLFQVGKVRLVPSMMTAASGGRAAWLRPDEVTYLDDAVARCWASALRSAYGYMLFILSCF